MNITGSNDTATISGNSVGAAVEDGTSGQQHLIGQLTVNDVDTGQNHFATPALAALTNAYGSFTFNPLTGVWAFDLANNSAAVQSLASGQIAHAYLTVTSVDGSASRLIDVTITGTNDKPMISVGALDIDGKSIAETNSGLTASGTLTITDGDTNDTVNAVVTGPVVVAGNAGSLTNAQLLSMLHIAPASLAADTGDHNNLTWNFDSNSEAFNYLAAGQSLTLTYTITGTDSSGTPNNQDTHTVTITIKGTNDAPVISSAAQAGDVKEDTTLTASGQVTATDVDHDAVLAYAGTATGTYGSFAVNATTGAWTYTLDNAAHQNLSANDTLSETYTVTVTDDKNATTTQNVTITIKGTNDAPVAHADTGAVLEDATLMVTAVNGVIQGTTGGSVADTDVDNATNTLIVSGVVAGAGAVTQGVGVATSIAGTYGHLNLTADGSYSYVADNANALAAGVTAVDTFTYTDKDPDGVVSNSTTLKITVTGVNDAPVVNANSGSLAYTENQVATAIDTALTLTDVDSVNLTGATVKITANFISGQDVLGFTTQNGITGIYNAATGIMTLTGSATVAQYQAALQSVTYFNSSDAPSALARTISYQVDDGSALNHASNIATATVSVTAVNDAPVISGAGNSVSYTEQAAAVIIDSVLTVTDPDNTNLNTATVTISNGFQTGDVLAAVVTGTSITAIYSAATHVLTLSGNDTLAHYQQVLDSVSFINSSNDNPTNFGANTSRTISWVANDGAINSNTGTSTINITAVNDAAILSADVRNLTEGNTAAVISSSGTLTISDVDSTATFVTQAGTVGSYGTFAINSAGVWSYTASSAHDEFVGGTTYIDTFSVASADGTATSVTVNILGTNDAATDLILTFTGTPGNSLPNGPFGQMSLVDPDGGAGSYSYALSSLTATTLAGGVASGVAGDLTVSSTGVISASGLDTDRDYEVTVQVTQGAATFLETFSVIVGTNAGETINGSYVTGDDVIFAVNADDTIFAGSGNDTVFGQAGSDQIHGGTGNDTLYGGVGNASDTFYFDTALDALTNVDAIKDFGAATEDSIALDHLIFANIGISGTLAAADFGTMNNGLTGTAASTVNIIYDSTNGNLYYDGDGANTTSGRTLFATLTLTSGIVDNTDFLII